MVAAVGLRVAVLGGDGRFDVRRMPGCRVRVYASTRYGGNGPVRRLAASIRAGGVDFVRVLRKWIGHSSCEQIVRLCRKLGVPFEVC